MSILSNEQLTAIQRMHDGCILCGGVGTGKSRTSIGYYYKQFGGNLNDLSVKMNEPRDLYIITTAHKRDVNEWEGELGLFCLSTQPELNRYSNKVVVDSWNNIKKYVGVRGAFFIFDEQRVIGNGVWVKSFLKIASENYWILLSATPGDKWEDYIPVFIANGFYKNRTQFEQEHIVFDWRSKYKKVLRYMNLPRLIRLRDKLLVDIPIEKYTVPHHEDVFCDYNRIEYKDLIRNRWISWKDKPVETASELCHCLRTIVNLDESRQAAVLELIEKHPKTIIFYNLDCELEVLRNLVYPEGTVIAEWNGHKHEPLPLEASKWVYLVQYTAGCEGWNCIETDTIIFYSQCYSYKTLAQAQGRIDRLNTPFTDLYYYYLKSRAPIDQQIARALAMKKDFNEGKYYNSLK